ncbi:hypothetical protein MKK69_25450 [Methylobacterium sp. J-026]|uniref:hypothetical protein n=1 Tax=Methylobacterium sp. J-026 TaxID=2836624 RepID=UPI001FBBE062|nr:hypothetical protein [Methylobacterium sp. J-026]MCJ2137350.1 hypothetical protein [Methylobacterium sp. J-026]
MNQVWSRLVAIGVAVVLVTALNLLEAADLEYAFADCAFAAIAAGIVVAAADLRP